MSNLETIINAFFPKTWFLGAKNGSNGGVIITTNQTGLAEQISTYVDIPLDYNFIGGISEDDYQRLRKQNLNLYTLTQQQIEGLNGF